VGVFNNSAKIGLDDGKGSSVAEDFVMARVYMFKNVYLHKTALVADGMLKLLLKRIKDLNCPNDIFPKKSLRKILMLERSTTLLQNYLTDFLATSDIDLYYLLTTLREANDEVLRRLSRGILERRLFKRVDGRSLDEIKKDITSANSPDMVQYYMCTINEQNNKAFYHPQQEEIYLFNKNGEKFCLSEKSSIFSKELKSESSFSEYYVDLDANYNA